MMFLVKSVSIRGNVCAVSAPRNDDNGDESGSVYIFRYLDPNWVEEAKLTAFDGGAYDYFGSSVFIDSGSAVIGAEAFL